MKTRLLSGLLSLLGFSGIAASCNNEEYQSAGEYGTPYARFTFKGTVTDAEAHSPQEGIRVISRSAEAPELTDTVYTDRAGAYLMEFEHIFPNVERSNSGPTHRRGRTAFCSRKPVTPSS